MLNYFKALICALVGCFWAANGTQILIAVCHSEKYQSIAARMGFMFVFFSLAVFYLSIRVAIKYLEKGERNVY